MSNEVVKKTDAGAIAKAPKNITEVVQGRISEMMARQELFMPSDYSPENALKSAWLKLQEVEDRNHNRALDVCGRESIANSLLDMVVQGLTPAKNQCYFVVYGKQLTLMRSYMGTVAVAKRFSEVKDVYANCIYEGDEFKYEIDVKTGLKRITKHEQDFMNINVKNIRGVYAVVIREGKEPFAEIMTMDQIKAAWGQGATKGNSPAHRNFAEEMAKKTVINRACKLFVNTSSDQAILTEAFNRTTEADYQRDGSKYYDRDTDVIVDVEDEDLTAQAAGAIFGEPEKPEPGVETAADEAKEPFTDEEKAEIEAMEAEAALQGMEALADGTDQG